ncbi:hypothetical protein [Marinagarivorans algicola]|uniref:hypothetical protein n=1 Tax=Marinagarivorans algicola TaxID=1513270 RepID=UPI0006B67FE3|nr:hypothetical protein [Marinagarivorans algicola]
MPDIHIDDFYRDTAKTLVALYNNFPRPLSLYVEDIAGPDTPDEFGLHSKRHESCLSTFIWLGNAGYLNYASLIMREALEAATLTHQAFILLNSGLKNDELNPKAPHGSEGLLINLLRRELENGTSGSLAILVKGVMAEADLQR